MKGRWSIPQLTPLKAYPVASSGTTLAQPDTLVTAMSRLGSTSTTSKNFIYQISSYTGSASGSTISFDLASSLPFALEVNLTPRQGGAGLTLVARGSKPFINGEG